MLAPKIEIDYAKCTTPFDCKKCLLICAPAVLATKPMKMTRGEETNKKEPGAYRLEAMFRDRCTGCLDCVNVCPVGALTVTIPKEVTA